jgi:hypothetical protein
MASTGSLIVRVTVDTHGALEDSRVGVIRRTLALWFLAAAQRLLRSRVDIGFESRR